jgi:hypothetical protein
MPDTDVTKSTGKLQAAGGPIKIYRLDLEKTTRV